MLPVPKHLLPMAGEIRQSAYYAEVTLHCPCGCERFHVDKSIWTEGEQSLMKAYDDALMKLNRKYDLRFTEDRRWQRKRKFLGLRWEDCDMPEAPAWWDVQCIRVICDACGDGAVVFDSRRHGYEGWAAKWPEETMSWQPQWRRITDERSPAIVTVYVENRDFALFLEENPQLTPEECSNLYESISICCKSGSKSHEVFSRETA